MESRVSWWGTPVGEVGGEGQLLDIPQHFRNPKC